MENNLNHTDLEKTDNVNEKQVEEVAQKKSKIPWKIIITVACVVAVAAIAIVITVIAINKPRMEVDKKAGFNCDDYIKLGQYKDFNEKISQEDFDECVHEETDSYESVDRGAKKTDHVDFSYKGSIEGKKIDDLTQKSIEIEIGNVKDEGKVYEIFSKALVGKKDGDKLIVKVPGNLASELTKSNKKYTDEVKFDIKVNSVSELNREEVTDAWVKENYSEEGLKTKKDFYDWIEAELEMNAKGDLWQKTVDRAAMSGWPAELYDSVKAEFDDDANFSADEMGMSLDEYLYNFLGYTDETLDEEYMNQVKSSLVMWAIIKEEGIRATDAEIENKYKEMYEECGYDSVEAMKKDYKKSEIEEAVLLEKAQNFVYEHSNVNKAYKIPS